MEESNLKFWKDAGHVARRTVEGIKGEIVAGKSWDDLIDSAERFIRRHGGTPAFPVTISVNDIAAHYTTNSMLSKPEGFEGEMTFEKGDLVKLDVGIKLQGWIGDNALTVPVGEINGEQKRLLAVTEESLFVAISHARAGAPLHDLCASVEDYVTRFGFTVVRDLVGHGVGRQLHEEPQVPNFRPSGKSPVLKAGMILAIEPMINAGVGTVDWLDDGWTVVTSDRRPSSHFEHTVLVTDGDPEILTWRPRTAQADQLGIPPLPA